MSALTSYRAFHREAAGFDGTTAEATGIYTQERFAWTTDVGTAVGRFSPASLNRVNVVSMMRIALEGTVNPGDEIRVRDASGGLRFTRPASVESSGWFLVLPDDQVDIFAPDATAADIIVDDLTDPQILQAALLEVNSGNQPAPPLQPEVVFLDTIGAFDVALPSLADTAHGYQILYIRRDSAGESFPRIIPAAVGDQVNGRAAIAGFVNVEYFLRGDNESILFTRVPGGWERRLGMQAPTRISSAASPIVIPPWTEGTLFVDDENGAQGTVVQLPAIVDCREGCRLVLHAPGSGLASAVVHELAPDGVNTINGIPASFLFCADYPGSVVTAELSGGTWVVASNNADLVPRNPTAIVAPGALPVRGGQSIVHVELAADGDLVLPSPGALPDGSSYTLVRTGGTGTPRIITSAPGIAVNGLTGTVATQYFLRSVGDAVMYRAHIGPAWTRSPFGDQAPAEVTATGNPLNVDAVKGGKAHILDAGTAVGNVTALPALADVPEGAGYLILNTDTDLHVVDGDGAETINGVVNRQHQRGEVMYIESSPSGWLALGGGNQGVPVVSAANINPTQVQLSGNITPFEMTGGAGQALNLPAVAGVAAGSMLVVFNSTAAAAHTIVPNGADEIDNANSAVASAAGTRIIVLSMGPTIGWVTILSA